MKRIILFCQVGDGMNYKFLTSTTNPDDNRLDMSSLGTFGVLYIADIISGADGDIDDMILCIPSIDASLHLQYNPFSDKFVLIK